jgi:hypothetical protein
MWAKKPARTAPTPPIPSKPAAPTVWRVKKAKSVFLYGSCTTIAAGQIVSASSHGEDAILRMIDQGVELEEVS